MHAKFKIDGCKKIWRQCSAIVANTHKISEISLYSNAVGYARLGI